MKMSAMCLLNAVPNGKLKSIARAGGRPFIPEQDGRMVVSPVMEIWPQMVDAISEWGSDRHKDSTARRPVFESKFSTRACYSNLKERSKFFVRA